MGAPRIPLFPLEVVLFPGMTLPLHIFEPRYKQMIGLCLEEKREFGVVLAQAEGIARVGCTARISTVTKRYEDGRMDILTVGRAPFRALEVLEEQPYYEAEVEFLSDEAAAAQAPGAEKLLALYAECHRLVFGAGVPVPPPEPGASVAYHVAGELPLELELKQELLESRAEAERQRILVERLKQWVPQLARQNRVQQKARGNGRGGTV